jgi:hypothetical protein
MWPKTALEFSLVVEAGTCLLNQLQHSVGSTSDLENLSHKSLNS